MKKQKLKELKKQEKIDKEISAIKGNIFTKILNNIEWEEIEYELSELFSKLTQSILDDNKFVFEDELSNEIEYLQERYSIIEKIITELKKIEWKAV